MKKEVKSEKVGEKGRKCEMHPKVPVHVISFKLERGVTKLFVWCFRRHLKTH